MGASRCRSAAGLYYFKRLRRTDWLPIRKFVDPDEESDRGPASEASSYDGGSDDESDCSTLRSRSDGYVSSDGHLSEPDTEIDEDGFPNIEDGPDLGHLSELEIDEDGFPIIEDGPDLGDEGGYVPTDGHTEPLDRYADLFGGPIAKCRKTAE